MGTQDKQVVISIKTIAITFLLVVVGYLLYKLGPIIGIFLVALFLVISMEPAVRFFMKFTFLNKPLSRGFSVVISYVLLVLILVSIVTLGFPPVILQARNLFSSLAKLPQAVNIGEELRIPVADLLPSFSEISGNLVSTTYSFFSNLVTFLSVIVVSLYMSVGWENMKARFLSFFPERGAEDAEDIVNTVEENIGHWVKGQLTLMLVVGVMSFIALTALGINSALALALIAGLLEIVPMLGPTISAVLVAIVGFSHDPLKGVIAFVLFLLIQQIENNFLVPRVMQKASGFSPVVIIFALLVGSRFFGVPGALLAVPATMILVIVVKKVLRYPSQA